jgi:hypothetical protein
MKMSDKELILKIANLENLTVVYDDEAVIMVEPFKGCASEHNPIKNDSTAHQLQCKYKVSVDFRMGRCYIESPYGSYLAGATYFKEGESPNRAILEAIYDAKDELV